jgi:viroplasmin and RNaseH domain-containing protein
VLLNGIQMVKDGKLNRKQIEEILLSFQKASARYPTFEEFCSHGKKLLPSQPMSAVEKEKLRQKVKYIVTKQKKMQASLREEMEKEMARSFPQEEVYRDDSIKEQIEKIENNASQDAIFYFKEIALSSSLETLNQKKAIAILHQIIIKEGINLANAMIARKSFDHAFSMAFDGKLLKLLELRKLL